MTEEQIEGFREVAIGVARATGRTGAAKVMERLLEERKRLLEALKVAASRPSLTQLMMVVDPAIAFAEEAAP